MKFICVAVMFALMSPVLAHAESPTERDSQDLLVIYQKSLNDYVADTLESVMKQLKVLLRQLLANAADDSKSAANAAAATQMASLFRQAQTFTPASIEQMPAPEKAKALEEFKGLLDQEATMADQLAQAFQREDHAAIDQLMKKMTDVKTEGHDRFDP